jgi:hypothetical protein
MHTHRIGRQRRRRGRWGRGRRRRWRVRVAAWVPRNDRHPVRGRARAAAHAPDVEVWEAACVGPGVHAVLLSTSISHAAVLNAHHLIDFRTLLGHRCSAVVSPDEPSCLRQMLRSLIGGIAVCVCWNACIIIRKRADASRREGGARHWLARSSRLTIVRSFDSRVTGEGAERAASVQPFFAVPAPAGGRGLRVAVRCNALRPCENARWRSTGAHHRRVGGARIDDRWVVALRLAFSGAIRTLACRAVHDLTGAARAWLLGARAAIARRTLRRDAGPRAERAGDTVQHSREALEIAATRRASLHARRGRFLVAVSLREIRWGHGGRARLLAYVLVAHVADLLKGRQQEITTGS